MPKNILALDIGGTKIHGAVYNGLASVKQLEIVTPKILKDFKYSLGKLVEFLSTGRKIDGIGAGVAGIVNSDQGTVAVSPNIKYLKGFNLKKFLSVGRSVPVMVDNDANCFTRAELMAGQGRGLQNFMALTLGTGVGGGLVFNGQLYRGAHYSAGEVGHITRNGKELEREFQRARDKKNFKELGTLLGVLLADMVNVLEPEAFILGGAVSRNHFKQFLPFIKAAMKTNVFNKSLKPKILQSKLSYPGTLGAALLFGIS